MKASKFTLGAAVLMLLSVSGWASDKMNADIHIYEITHVGSTQLVPGEYRMTWTEGSPNAEVTFTQGRKVVATVPAQITQEKSEYDGPALLMDRGSKTLTGIQLPKILVSFTGKDAHPAKSGN